MHQPAGALLLGPTDLPWAVWLSGSSEVLERPTRDAALSSAASRNNVYARTLANGPAESAQYAVVLHNGRVWTGDETPMSARVSVDTRKVHIRLAEQLRDRIRAKDLRPGEMLPSQRDLATVYRVAINTVERAQHLLIEEGLLCKTGRGIAVAKAPPIEAQALPGLCLTPIHPPAEPAPEETSHFGTAAYRVLAEELATKIHGGAYPEGTIFPSARVLAEQHGYTLTSAQQAVRSLKDLKLLVEGPGRRTMVAHRPATKSVHPSTFP